MAASDQITMRVQFNVAIKYYIFNVLPELEFNLSILFNFYD